MRKRAMIILDILVSAVLFIAVLPFLLIGLLWAGYRKLELKLRYRGDTDERDRAEYKSDR